MNAKINAQEVPVRDRAQQKRPDDGHDVMTFTMQSVSEGDTWKRVFPDPLPPGHRLVHHWNDLRLIVQVERDPDYKAAADVATGPTPSDPAEPDKAGVKVLGAMRIEELLTLGAEIGAPVNKKMTKSAVVAAIVARQQELKAAPPPAEREQQAAQQQQQ